MIKRKQEFDFLISPSENKYRMEGINYCKMLEKMPAEIIVHIISFLNLDDILNFSLTNHFINVFARDYIKRKGHVFKLPTKYLEFENDGSKVVINDYCKKVHVLLIRAPALPILSADPPD